MKVTHLYHSGILIETDKLQIFIDVISDIDHHLNRDKEIYFLVTHSHRDHYDPTIFRYAAANVCYILSDDIQASGQGLRQIERSGQDLDRADQHRNIPDQQLVMPNRHYEIGAITLDTFGSTDLGVSFLMTVDGRRIFHAGDLNWWHWASDTPEQQEDEAQSYKKIVDSLPNNRLDLAFIPCDPRLGEAMTWAVEYFLKAKDVSHLVPMHFRTHFEAATTLWHRCQHDERVVQVDRCDQLLIELSPEGVSF